MAKRSTMGDGGGARFVVLPDHPVAASRFARLDAAHILTHASGRPWLMGHWSVGEAMVAQAGEARLALIGCSSATGKLLLREAERLRDLVELDRLAGALAGSFHLVASLGGRVRVQGSASGLRLVFHACLDGVTVATDRADLLAEVCGAGLDEQQVAVRLLGPFPPHPLSLTSLWRSIHTVAPGSYLVLKPDGRAHESNWWTPPQPERPLAAGAEPLRDALDAAVQARTRAGGTISCDLSGGMDSTSISFLAARGPAMVIVSTALSRDPADDDAYWADLAAARMPAVEHAVWPAEQTPLAYENMSEFDDLLDEPNLAVFAGPGLMSRVLWLLSQGSRLHLTGMGGDHVTWCAPAHYHDLLRRRPLFAIRQLRGFRALHHWPLGETLRALADRRPYQRWLAAAVSNLDKPPPKLRSTLGWAAPPRLPPWATGTAVEAARQAIQQAASTAQPLAATRGQHADLANVRAGIRMIRLIEQMSARAGLPMASPFFDDRVIEACLAVRPQERVSPWSYRPLLKAAMRGVVPDECLERTSKAAGDMMIEQSLREQRDQLLAFWDGSVLAEMGLVDEAVIRACLDPLTPQAGREFLNETISCEMWLRAIKGARRDLAATRVTQRQIRGSTCG